MRVLLEQNFETIVQLQNEHDKKTCIRKRA